MSTYFGFAIADSMLPEECIIKKRHLLEVYRKEDIEEAIPCINPSHSATIHALHERYGITVSIPASPPRVVLEYGDSLIVMGVRGLPRLTDRHEYTADEVAKATFTFSLYQVCRLEDYRHIDT